MLCPKLLNFESKIHKTFQMFFVSLNMCFRHLNAFHKQRHQNSYSFMCHMKTCDMRFNKLIKMNYYQILKCDRNSTKEEIRRKYLELSLEVRFVVFNPIN